MPATMPATGPISSKAISASDLHCAAEAHADHEPGEAGQEAELRREHRPDQRPGAGDRGEVVAEEDPLVGGVVVLAVVLRARGHGGGVVEGEHARREECGVVAVRDRDAAQRDDEDREGVHERGGERSAGRAGREGRWAAEAWGAAFSRPAPPTLEDVERLPPGWTRGGGIRGAPARVKLPMYPPGAGKSLEISLA